MSSRVDGTILGIHRAFKILLYPAFHKLQSPTKTGENTNFVKMVQKSSQAGEY